MKKSASAKFPFKEDYENNCLKRAHTVEETVISAIRLFLLTRKGSRVGNDVGSLLPELLFTLIPKTGLSGVASELKAELTQQFPGVEFVSVTLATSFVTTADLIISITFSVLTQDKLTDMEVVLPSIFSPEILANLNKTEI